MEIRVGSQVFPRLLPHRISTHPSETPFKATPGESVVVVKIPEELPRETRRAPLLSRVLSRLATSPFQSSF